MEDTERKKRELAQHSQTCREQDHKGEGQERETETEREYKRGWFGAHRLERKKRPRKRAQEALLFPQRRRKIEGKEKRKKEKAAPSDYARGSLSAALSEWWSIRRGVSRRACEATCASAFVHAPSTLCRPVRFANSWRPRISVKRALCLASPRLASAIACALSGFAATDAARPVWRPQHATPYGGAFATCARLHAHSCARIVGYLPGAFPLLAPHGPQDDQTRPIATAQLRSLAPLLLLSAANETFGEEMQISAS